MHPFMVQWSSTDLTLRDRLGGGNFGQVYEGLINERKGATPAEPLHLAARQQL